MHTYGTMHFCRHREPEMRGAVYYCNVQPNQTVIITAEYTRVRIRLPVHQPPNHVYYRVAVDVRYRTLNVYQGQRFSNLFAGRAPQNERWKKSTEPANANVKLQLIKNNFVDDFLHLM